MILTQLIWIAGLVAFFIVGTSIASAISALARQIGAPWKKRRNFGKECPNRPN